MKYKVHGTVEFNVSMLIEADTKAEAESIAMDRMDDGSLDGFTLEDTVGNNEVTCVVKVAE